MHTRCMSYVCIRLIILTRAQLPPTPKETRTNEPPMSSSSADPGSSATSAAGVGGHPSQAPAGDLASATATLTLTEEGEGEGTEQVQVLRLRLQPRRSVHW